jgi:hypothetical protein
MMTMTTEDTDPFGDRMGWVQGWAHRKRFVVMVGGWRPVGQYDTLREAQRKAETCISKQVEILEREAGSFPIRGFSKRFQFQSRSRPEIAGEEE